MTRSEEGRRTPKWVGRWGGQAEAWRESMSGRGASQEPAGEFQLAQRAHSCIESISVVTTDSFSGRPVQGSSDRQQSIHSPTYYHLCLALFSPLLRSPSGMASRSPDTHMPSPALQDDSARQDSKQKDSLDRGKLFLSFCRLRAQYQALSSRPSPCFASPRALSDHTCIARRIDFE